jgi:hypothetical protein
VRLQWQDNATNKTQYVPQGPRLGSPIRAGGRRSGRCSTDGRPTTNKKPENDPPLCFDPRVGRRGEKGSGGALVHLKPRKRSGQAEKLLKDDDALPYGGS